MFIICTNILLVSLTLIILITLANTIYKDFEDGAEALKLVAAFVI